MVGFIKGLFGGKPQSEKTAPEAEKPKKAEKPSSSAYFLPPDDAKTFGDIEYMRTSKSVRRTFPKTAGGEEYAVVKQVSSTDGGVISDRLGEAIAPPMKPETAPSNQSTAQSTAQPTETSTARRSTDTSMDIFRNMARDIKKR